MSDDDKEIMKTKVWIALLAIYIVWGSTYLAIRFAVETIPPFFMAGTRFLISGLILYIWRRLAGDPAPTPRQWRSAIIVGLLLLLGGNGVVSWAEQHVASGYRGVDRCVHSVVGRTHRCTAPARRQAGLEDRAGLADRLRRHRAAGGFIGAANRSSRRHEPVRASGRCCWLPCCGPSARSISRDADMPKSSLLGTGIEMLGGSAGLFLGGHACRRMEALNVSAISMRSLLGLAYLITFGSLIGFTSYVLAAAQCARVAGLDLRLRQPGGGDLSGRLAGQVN